MIDAETLRQLGWTDELIAEVVRTAESLRGTCSVGQASAGIVPDALSYSGSSFLYSGTEFHSSTSLVVDYGSMQGDATHSVTGGPREP